MEPIAQHGICTPGVILILTELSLQELQKPDDSFRRPTKQSAAAPEEKSEPAAQQIQPAGLNMLLHCPLVDVSVSVQLEEKMEEHLL